MGNLLRIKYLAFSVLYSRSPLPGQRRGAPRFRAVNQILTKLMTGNKSGALLLTTFVLKPGVATNGLPKARRERRRGRQSGGQIGEACLRQAGPHDLPGMGGMAPARQLKRPFSRLGSKAESLISSTCGRLKPKIGAPVRSKSRKFLQLGNKPGRGIFACL